MTEINFEDGPPITSEVEVLRMIVGKYDPSSIPGVESFISEHALHGPYICQGMISGWPERTEWQKFYRLDKDVFETLKTKGYIRKNTPTSWDITKEGISHLRSA